MVPVCLCDSVGHAMYVCKEQVKCIGFGLAMFGIEDRAWRRRDALEQAIKALVVIDQHFCHAGGNSLCLHLTLHFVCPQWKWGVSCHCPGTWLVLQIKKRARGAEFDFNSPEWAAISDGAKDLLRKLIVRNPAVCVLSCHSLGHGPGSASLCTVPVLLRSLCYT